VQIALSRFSLSIWKIDCRGPPALAFLIVVLLGACAHVLGSFFSNFARSEYQVVQFIPMVITPQIVLCGLFWPLKSIPESLRPISYILPLTYSSNALRAVMIKGAAASQIMPDKMAHAAFFVLFFVLSTLMLKREV
jgi:ABC-2 type transport system permease protein